MTLNSSRVGSSTTARRLRPRSPGVTYAAMSLALLVALATFVLTSHQPRPPTIAEFAPQAVEQISGASEQSQGLGGATGTTGSAAEPADAVRPAPGTIDVARARQCVGDPPRQIEDPQSPPCVPYWSGDNGGATSRGVTRDEIRIALPAELSSWPLRLIPFFNRRFEFYGRRFHPVVRAVPIDQPGQRAAARAVYEQDVSFASSGPGTYAHAYLDELARLGVVNVHFSPLFPEPYMASRRPYLWTYPMANDRLFATAGSWYCARFAGRDAVHAGDPVLQLSPRKPGIVLTDADWEGTSAEPLNRQLASCGGRAEPVIHMTDQSFNPTYYATSMENAMLQMKTSGVTSVICLCYMPLAGVLAMRAATNQGYFPEWMVTNFVQNEQMGWLHIAGPREQIKSLMLLLASPKQGRYADHPSTWAAQEVRAGTPGGSNDQYHYDINYWMLLLLASGVQMAGPHLTPDTFERGLHKVRFPNPPHRIMAGDVGFGEGGGWAGPDHSMTDDTVEVWWSNTVRSPYPQDEPGAFCYVDDGARRRIGAFPASDPFFSGTCDTGA